MKGDATRLGACVRSIRLLQDQGAMDAARDVADAFATECGAGALAGDALCAYVAVVCLSVVFYPLAAIASVGGWPLVRRWGRLAWRYLAALTT